MGTPRINYDATLTAKWVAKRLFRKDPFCLIDVGASGGIEGHWRQFEPDLEAFGFDPLVRECERLNRSEKNKKVRYYSYFIATEDYPKLISPTLAEDPVQGWTPTIYERSSAVAAQNTLRMSFERRFNNEDPDVVYTDGRISLNAFCQQRTVTNVDFIKIDTDGHDYEVLLGADGVLHDGLVLGVFIECQLHGITHPHANVFANIDRLLREHGFSLFDFEIYRYTRAALPGHFVYTIPAQTREGQVLWGDALYFRDVAAPGYFGRWPLNLSPTKVLKLACLYEIYGLPDCAADLLLTRREDLAPLVDVVEALDILAREIEPSSASYDALKRQFENAPTSFYPDQSPVPSGAGPAQRKAGLLQGIKRRVFSRWRSR